MKGLTFAAERRRRGGVSVRGGDHGGDHGARAGVWAGDDPDRGAGGVFSGEWVLGGYGFLLPNFLSQVR